MCGKCRGCLVRRDDSVNKCLQAPLKKSVSKERNNLRHGHVCEWDDGLGYGLATNDDNCRVMIKIILKCYVVILRSKNQIKRQ